MIIWINGCFGSGKSSAAYELKRRLPSAFIYDPEKLGFFLRKNAPKIISENCFQSLEAWREANYLMLKEIAARYDGVVIAPQTLRNPDYFGEIIGRLRQDGVDVRHVIIKLGEKELRRRIRKREKVKDSWAEGQIEQSIKVFNETITEGAIDADSLTAAQTAKAIAEYCGLKLKGQHKDKCPRKNK